MNYVQNVLTMLMSRCFKESSDGINKVDKLIIENANLDLQAYLYYPRSF